jgi:hypothetical protein
MYIIFTKHFITLKNSKVITAAWREREKLKYKSSTFSINLTFIVCHGRGITTGDLVAAVVTDFNYFSFFVKQLQERMFGR